MYSGGGGRVGEQHVVLMRPGEAGGADDVLTVPGNSGMMIRACFSERDMKQRACACHDEYSLSATLSFVPVEGEMPLVRLETEASSFPRGVSRDRDSLAGPPLKERDLVQEVDRACTYTRTFRFDPVRKRYLPDAPLPDCSQYLDG